jgi:ribulose-phosphate 3-epimerase
LHLYRTIQVIKESGSKAGVALNPSTPVDTLKDVLDELDLVLIMTVEPGFGGQQFIKSTIRKIQELRKMIDISKKNIFLEVDGGIDQDTAAEVISAGANVLVAGTSVFKAESMKTAIASLRTSSKVSS